MTHEIEQMYRIKEVLKRVPISRALFYRLVKENKAPQPVRLSERTSMWRAVEINKWLQENGISA